MLPQKKAQLKITIIILLYKLHDWNFDISHKNYKESKYNADYFCKSDAFPVKDFFVILLCKCKATSRFECLFCGLENN